MRTLTHLQRPAFTVRGDQSNRYWIATSDQFSHLACRFRYGQCLVATLREGPDLEESVLGDRHAQHEAQNWIRPLRELITRKDDDNEVS